MPDRVVTVTIDDKECGAREDESILDVARDNDVFIPTLCHFEGLSIWGGCRLCVVEVKGSNRLMAACATRVSQDMVVTTDNERITEHRRLILEMLLSERNHVCSVCVSNGKCDLQWLAQRCGVDHVRLPYRYPNHTLDLSHDLFRNDPNRCILCTRCVRVCDEVEGAHTWDVMGRGIQCDVITDLKMPWGDSDTCTSCGKCVQVCPTGALSPRLVAVPDMHKRREIVPALARMREDRK